MGRRNGRQNIKKVNNSSIKKQKIQSEEIKNNNSDKNETLKKFTINDLENKIESLSKYFKKYPNKTSTDNIDKIKNDLNNQEYKIAVVANMSAGKSTFINALFGKEILPARNEATTDSATYIYSKSNIEKRAIVYFNDGKKEVEIKDDLEKEIKKYAQKDEKREDNKYKNVENIELFYPFKNLQTSSSKDFKITFIDTPGPNSTGKNYAQKHKDQTRKVLNEVDLALFMFDFGQTDATLSDEQGLWNTIKKRHDKDKNFDIYFILNKIDMAFDDNFASIEGEANDVHEYIELMKKEWCVHEEKAIEKLEKAAKDHGINEPRIYPVSSKNQLLKRENPKFGKKRKDFKSFKDVFQDIFPDQWESKFIEYLGIEKLEKDINKYIDSSVKDKILKKISSQLNNIHNDENKKLETSIKMLEKPKEEAQKNLKESTEFLGNKANDIEQEFREKSLEIQREYIDEIKKVINTNIEKELKRNTKEAVNRTIKFLELLLEGHSEQDAMSDSKNLPLEQIKDNLNNGSLRITVKDEFEVETIEKSLQNFIVSILNDYKNNYLDMKIDIKNNYSDMAEVVGILFNEYKFEFDKELKNTLKVDTMALDENSLYMKSSFNEDIKVPDSTIEYKYQGEEFSSGGSFSSREKIKDEKHSIIISPSNIEKIFDLSIASIKRSYLNQEIKTYEDTIVEFIKGYQNKFNEFKRLKKQEIKQIEKDLENSKQNLETVLAQYSVFNKIQKEI